MALFESPWVITSDGQGVGPAIDQGSKTLKDKQVAFDAEITAIVRGGPQVVPRQRITTSNCSLGFYERHRQQSARAIRVILHTLEQEGRTAEIQWVKGHARIPSNERTDLLASKAAEKTAV
jgi:hypothetical protein